MSARYGNQNAKKPPGETANGMLYVRCKKQDKGRWTRAARREQKKLSAWVNEKLNEAVNQEKRS